MKTVLKDESISEKIKQIRLLYWKRQLFEVVSFNGQWHHKQELCYTYKLLQLNFDCSHDNGKIINMEQKKQR